MAFPQIYSVDLTTAADGTVTAFTPIVRGEIVNVIYVKTDFATGVDFTITTEDTLQTVWTDLNVDAAKSVVPRQATHTTLGVAGTYDGTRAVLGPVFALNEKIKIIIGSGGDTKTGVIKVIIV